MSPSRNQRMKFRFSADVPVNVAMVTQLDVIAPSAPWRARTVQPTITRVFKRHGTSRRSKSSLDAKRRELEVVYSGDSSDADDDHTRLRQPTDERREGATSTDPSSRPRPQGQRSDLKFIDLDLQRTINAGRKGKARQDSVRYSSVTSVASEDAPPPLRRSSTPSAQSVTAPHVSTGGEPLPPSDGAVMWTRYGKQNGEPVFMRKKNISSTKDKDCLTFWWECFSSAPLRELPDLSTRPEFALGDILVNRVIGVKVPQGDIREDGRRLSITPKERRPSWVKADWAVKQMVKYWRGQSDFDTDTLRDAFIDTLAPVLLSTPVLPTLSRLHRTLDALDIEGLAALWARVRPVASASSKSSSLPTSLGEGMSDPDVEEKRREGKKWRYGYGRRVALPRARAPPRRVLATVTVIDLDVKGVDRLAKWAALDREIVDVYRAATAGDEEAGTGRAKKGRARGAVDLTAMSRRTELRMHMWH
ncbi:hypothetical protein BC628DRAFT_1418238 [Trametes gibbosa]|nr:hypothetical protein BC628DRAFT_1418238 [Trametes gibbosa]